MEKNSEELKYIPIKDIICKEDDNIRMHLGSLQGLIHSIKERGENIEPIGVKPEGKKYRLIFGYRRFAAMKILKFEKAKCIIKEYEDDDDVFMTMYNENAGRRDLTWREEVNAFRRKKKILLSKNISISQIIKEEAEAVDKTERAIWEKHRVVKAVDEFNFLFNEKTKNDVLEKYDQLKKLSVEEQDKIKERGNFEVSQIDLNLSTEKKIREAKRKKTSRIKSLSEEEIVNVVGAMNKERRNSLGLWNMEDLVNVFDDLECEGYGYADPKEGFEGGYNEEYCITCKSQKPDRYSRCQIIAEYLRNKKK